MNEVLEMIFKTGEGKVFRLTLNDPRADVTPAEIQAAMNSVVALNPFNVTGGLTEAVEANIITTQTAPVVFA